MHHSAVVFNTMLWNKRVLMCRYRLDTVLRMATFYTFFLLAFMGAQTLAGSSPNFGDTVGGLVVGFLVWTLVTIAFMDLSGTLSTEASQGTLEQLAMAPSGLSRVLLSRAVASLGYQIMIAAVFLLVMMATTGRWLHLDLLSILPVLVLTVSGVLGIGLIMGGLTLLYKQTGALLGILQFAFLGLLALPVQQYAFLKAAPLSWGSYLLGQIMVDGHSLLTLPAADLLLLVANSAGYVTLGVIVFKLCEAKARERGLLGQY